MPDRTSRYLRRAAPGTHGRCPRSRAPRRRSCCQPACSASSRTTRSRSARGRTSSASGSRALAATLAAVALTIVGARRNDGRTVLLGTAFTVMAALLALHGLATPGIILAYNGLVGFTGGPRRCRSAAPCSRSRLCPSLRRPRGVAASWCSRPVLLVAIAGSGPRACSDPSLLNGIPQARRPDRARRARGVAVVFYGVLLLRARADLPAHAAPGRPRRRRRAGLAAGAPCRRRCCSRGPTSAGGSATCSSSSGILAVGVQVALDLRRSAQSRPLSGDLRAAELVAEEEAFLGARVRALDPAPRREGRVDRGAHAPGGDARRPGRRGARPPATPPARSWRSAGCSTTSASSGSPTRS